jgi:hypothetical protein
VGVYGSINGGPPQVSLTGPCWSPHKHVPQSHNVSDYSQGGPGAIFITDALPCNQYTLNLTVGNGQVMGVQRFGYAPCPPGTAASAYKGSSSIPGTFSDAGARSKPLSAALIAIIVFSSVVVFLALAGLVLLLHMRRQRQRKRQGSRSIGT